MAFNGSGVYSLYSPGNPVVTNTTISSSWANNTLTDIATALSTTVLKDGQQTATARVPFALGISNGSQTLTAVATGTATTHAATVGQIQSSAATLLGTVAGTNTVTAVATPVVTAYASGQKFVFVPAVTNTAATTINIDGVGAKNIFWNGAACVGGELRANIPVLIEYDGTQFHIIGNGFNAPFLDTHAVVEGSADSTKKVRFEVDGLTTATTRVVTVPDRDFTMSAGITLGTEQATTSGTSIDFTGIPSGVKRITINFKGVSIDNTSDVLIQLGDSGGIENTGYLGAGTTLATATMATTNYTAGFGLRGTGATTVLHGSVVLSLENSVSFSWACSGNVADSANPNIHAVAGAKSTSAELDRVRITTAGGVVNFDAGAINIAYE